MGWNAERDDEMGASEMSIESVQEKIRYVLDIQPELYKFISCSPMQGPMGSLLQI